MNRLQRIAGALMLCLPLAAAAAAQGQVLHNSGLWRLPNVYPCRVAAETGKLDVFDWTDLSKLTVLSAVIG